MRSLNKVLQLNGVLIRWDKSFTKSKKYVAHKYISVFDVMNYFLIWTSLFERERERERESCKWISLPLIKCIDYCNWLEFGRTNTCVSIPCVNTFHISAIIICFIEISQVFKTHSMMPLKLVPWKIHRCYGFYSLMLSL